MRPRMVISLSVSSMTDSGVTPRTSACRLASVVTYVKPPARVALVPSGLTSVTETLPVCAAGGSLAVTDVALLKVTWGDAALPKKTSASG